MGGDWEGFGVRKESLFDIVYILKIFLQIFCNYYMFVMFVLEYFSVFLCLFVCKCVLGQLSGNYCNLNVCLRDLQTMWAHILFNFIFSQFYSPCNKGERLTLYSLYRECNLYSNAYKSDKVSLLSSQLFHYVFIYSFFFLSLCIRLVFIIISFFKFSHL